MLCFASIGIRSLHCNLIYALAPAPAYHHHLSYLSLHPDAGNVEPESGGIRKLRWSSDGRGKQGGVRIIYYNRLENGEIWLLTLYSKKELNQLSKKTLKLLVEKLNDSLND